MKTVITSLIAIIMSLSVGSASASTFKNTAAGWAEKAAEVAKALQAG